MKSPLKGSPLRNPAETLDREINDLILDDVMTYLIVIFIMGAVAFIEVFLWWLAIPRNPYIYPIMFVLTLAYCVPKLVKLKTKVKLLKQGRDGEKVVGQYLERLREDGAKIFHDIPGENFNLDHVVVSSSGIYVIETKTYSKPDSGATNIVFDGINIKYNGIKTDRPIIQVKAASHWLNELLKESLGRQYSIKPVVVFPGWFVQPTSEAKSSDVWVLNPKALPAFISKSSNSLTSEEINLIAFNISRYVRNTDI